MADGINVPWRSNRRYVSLNLFVCICSIAFPFRTCGPIFFKDAHLASRGFPKMRASFQAASKDARHIARGFQRSAPLCTLLFSHFSTNPRTCHYTCSINSLTGFASMDLIFVPFDPRPGNSRQTHAPVFLSITIYGLFVLFPRVFSLFLQRNREPPFRFVNQNQLISF